MIDRTIPFYNTILRCDYYLGQDVPLPNGYEIVSYQDGYEDDWARLEFAIADFDSIEEAKRYFVSNYLTDRGNKDNLLFILNPEKQVIGSCIAWQDKRKDSKVASLHWLVVEEKYQGMGLGRALCLATMNRFEKQNMLPVYIHTQPWSWKAILLYISVGFRIQKSDTFSNYENQYEKAMGVLHDVVDRRCFEIMRNSAESDNTYCSDGKIVIRNMKKEDADVFFNTYLSYGWHPNIETYETYYREQETGKRKVFIAEYNGEVAGICTLLLKADNGPFAEIGYPEIVDLSVFVHLRKHGIGNKLLDVAESEAFKVSDTVCLAVGVHSGYGPAQRIYVKRGFVFDGSGVWYQGRQLEQYASCVNDDDLVLYMSKNASKPGQACFDKVTD